MQVLRTQMRIALKHLPVAMPGNERDFLDAQTACSQSASADTARMEVLKRRKWQMPIAGERER